MIIVTGSAGFIGSCMVSKLNNKGITNIALVDDFSKTGKLPNIANKRYQKTIDRNDFFGWLESNGNKVDFIFHLGARTDTAEFNTEVLNNLNLNYSKKIWDYCCKFNIPLVYASSAATYGDGSDGYDDSDPGLSERLKPLNPYGVSKNEFDKWALAQINTPPHWFGLKFFNVFGPNEYHKGRMASVVFHAFRQIRGFETKQGAFGSQHQAKPAPAVRLFRSHNPNYPDGGQLRDFIYVKDVIDVMYFLMDRSWLQFRNHMSGSIENPAPLLTVPESGLYNLGTGHARTFLDLVTAVFTALSLPPSIEYIDTPADIRDKYQYFTEARMEKLRQAGYSKPFFTLETAIEQYVQGYLRDGNCF